MVNGPFLSCSIRSWDELEMVADWANVRSYTECSQVQDVGTHSDCEILGDLASRLEHAKLDLLSAVGMTPSSPVAIQTGMSNPEATGSVNVRFGTCSVACITSEFEAQITDASDSCKVSCDS